jgi:HK97 gp10 family phage protein
MTGIQVQVKGAEQLARTLNAAARKLMDQRPANLAAGQDLMKSAMAKAPKRTGRLRGSITVLRNDQVQVQVGSSVRYAGFQNYGTRHNRPTYFLTGALGQLTTEPYDRYADKVMGTVKGA